MKLSSLVTLIASNVFGDILGLEDPFNELVDEIWEMWEVVHTRMVLFEPSLDDLHIIWTWLPLIWP